ncbi:hypothetical protein [Paraburkholderia hospita]|uniref:Uncharacterized protein n=1 Tax=Paraburkholderia hospita TaxID=169430 RepID=A0AAN1MJ95_9BURK|nr:hypothetical protein [Paraburkholderia hospita]AUT69172.1 hypothetical protein C2L64_13295 [Paraburkholderia hospita]EIM96411.1 hypothetical protein WQE_33666 [Paraburkholderia hospita]OUL77176.1 hypothetical protein CA602_33185 [Paraburkholderia hospita]OUL95875.1 hypothetical protein CA603_06920 [Paraburkholderia hospita]OUL96548.1 hypothetical protein CA601_02145 [Paraburkholderia hospita]
MSELFIQEAFAQIGAPTEFRPQKNHSLLSKISRSGLFASMWHELAQSTQRYSSDPDENDRAPATGDAPY